MLRMLHQLRHTPLFHHLRPRISTYSISFSTKYLLILPNSSLPSALRSLHNSSSRSAVRFQHRALCTACELDQVNVSEEGYFLAEEGISWKSLGISEKVSRALSDTGLQRPSFVQVLYTNCSMKGAHFLPLFAMVKHSPVAIGVKIVIVC